MTAAATPAKVVHHAWLRCPACQSDRVVVGSTVGRKAGKRVRRYMRCRGCGWHFVVIDTTTPANVLQNL